MGGEDRGQAQGDGQGQIAQVAGGAHRGEEQQHGGQGGECATETGTGGQLEQRIQWPAGAVGAQPGQGGAAQHIDQQCRRGPLVGWQEHVHPDPDVGSECAANCYRKEPVDGLPADHSSRTQISDAEM